MSSRAPNSAGTSSGKQSNSKTLEQRLTVPSSLKEQLSTFRARVWSSKVGEAFTLGVTGLLLAFLTVYLADRIFDTPSQARFVIFFGSLALWLAVPWALHRWVWKNRRLDQLARLLRVREPAVGDQLLSVIELAEDDSEQARSRTLCAAAIEQVATAAKGRDFRTAAPPTHLRGLAMTLGCAAIITVGLWVLFPDAASNAWARFASPWRDTPRYTFTEIERIPPNMVIPHGESLGFSVLLTEDSRWQPETASIQLGRLAPMTATLDGSRYQFELPPQTAPIACRLKVGDYSQIISIEPKLRPELVAASASIVLPSYLERQGEVEMDVRSGLLSVVDGSTARISATASRPLSSGRINEQLAEVSDATFTSGKVAVEADAPSLTFSWEDFDGLAGREPFSVDVKSTVDEMPSVVSQGLPRQAVVLDTEQLNFEALASDDFGVKHVGIEWRSLDETLLTEAAQGEKLLGAGSPERSNIQLPAVFCASDLGIAPQPIEVRLWAEDYMPERERVYSTPHVLFVLNAEQHALWITSQLSKWHRAALDVRDKEMQLHEANKRLRATSPEALDNEEMRGELRRQAALEASNGRRLTALASSGEDLLRQAARNPEIGVGHLDRWAEMLQLLNDIGTNRMPSVSDLLEKSSTQKSVARGNPKKNSGPMAGQVKSAKSGGSEASEPHENQPEQPTIPKVVDAESSLQPSEDEEPAEQGKPKKKFNGSRQGLAQTTLTGPAPKPEDKAEEEPEEEEDDTFAEALVEQEDLLAEFEKIADELNNILANLEGSTLVKRLKAASREQNQVAEKISSRITTVFGAKRLQADDLSMLKELSGIEEDSSQKISYIMDDMQAYFERRKMNQFRLVLEDMKETDVLTAIQVLGEEIPKEQGMSIAQAEFWADNLDRWAEDLVDPACSGQCPGSKTSDSLPPSVILEVLRILEGEVNLREATRVAEQAREAVEQGVHDSEAVKLSSVQTELRDRTDVVVQTIIDLPKGNERFAKEIKLLSSVSTVMIDAAGILESADTGINAIAAETEAIELLLQCKRINPKSGGGGGTSPGGGGKGDTQDSAIALLGSGLNQNERREQRAATQATGETGRVLPEEFRAGLDAYFNRIESE